MRENKTKSDSDNFYKINLVKIVLKLSMKVLFQNYLRYPCQRCPQLKHCLPTYVSVL